VLELSPRQAQQPAGRPAAQALPGLRLINASWIAPLAGAISGFLLWLAFPPVDLGSVAFLALVPLALVFRGASWGRASAAGAAFGIVFFGLLLDWLRQFGWAPFLALTLGQTMWVVVFLHAGVTARRNIGDRWAALVFPLAFLAGEFTRAYLPLGGFTWGGLGYSQHDYVAFLKLASYTGVWGLSLVVAAVGALVAEAVATGVKRRGRGVVLALSAAGLVLVPGLLPAGSPQGRKATVAMVQGNLPLSDQGTPESDDFEVLQSHAELTGRLEPTEAALVVWPESTLDVNPEEVPDFLEVVRASIRAAEAPLLLGTSIDVDQSGFRNASLLYSAAGKLTGSYDKMHLVPYGEYVPGRRLLEPVFEQLGSVPRDGIAGTRPVVFSIPEGSFSVAICYESTFPELMRSFVEEGARLLIVSTNNSSFGRTAASSQHVAFSQLRAAEHRMWIAHTALTGISAVVAPDGRVIEETGVFERALLTPEVQFATAATFYARAGDWVPIAAFIALGGLWLLPVVQALLRRGRGGP
jgi:apolipoprotein N-acyltransferase